MSENQATLLLRKQLKGEAVVFSLFFFDLSFHCFSPFDDGLWFSLFTLERFKSSSFSLQFISQQGLPLRLFLLTTFEE
jgi:hypothetical protein